MEVVFTNLQTTNVTKIIEITEIREHLYIFQTISMIHLIN